MGKNIALASGWIVALVLAGVLYAQLQTVRALQEKLDTAEAAMASVKDAAARVVSLEEKCEALEAMIADLKSESEGGLDAAAAVRDTVSVPKGFDPKALVKNMFGGDKAGEGEEKSGNPLAAMFEGEAGEKMMEVMLPAQVDMQYGPILSELGLSEERRAALREVLLEHARKGAAIGMAMMRGEKKLEDIEVPGDEDLMAAVGEVLDPEELAQFERYQEELPERMMRQQFDMQMGMMAGDLPEEVRATAVDVLVENLLAAQPDQKLGVPDFEAMRAAFDDTLVVLEQELEPEHLERVRAVILQQRAGIDMAARMFGGGEQDDAAIEAGAPAP